MSDFSALALPFAQAYLQNLGILEYNLDYVDLLVPPSEARTQEAQGQYWFIVQADSFARIESEIGVYSMSHTRQFIHKRVHTNNIKISNLSTNAPAHVQALVCTIL